jgi:hypothetical protein
MQVVGVGPGSVDLGGARADLVRDEITDHLPELLLFRQQQIRLTQ